MPPRVGIVGAGRMGIGIAEAFALAGVGVDLLDAKQRDVAESAVVRFKVETSLREGIQTVAMLGLLEERQVAAVASRVAVHTEDQLEEVLGSGEISHVVEAVPEILAVKEAVLVRIGRATPSGVAISSATSSFLTDDLARYVSHPERFLDAHWLNPAFLIPLVELSPGSATDPDVLVEVRRLLESVGKVTVTCAPSPGFIVPRIQALVMNEAARLVEEGVATVEDVDTACRLGFGIRFAVMGVLEFIDWGGCDVLYHVSNYLREALPSGERYSPPAIITDRMRSGLAGNRESGAFYGGHEADQGDYRLNKLGEYVGLLRHLGLLPSYGSSREN
ncbi:MAG: 3-hydroxyacyl-CoA dehydrogenase NAD-binding domain-containing protein [Candidatus Dormibacteria bacterium]